MRRKRFHNIVTNGRVRLAGKNIFIFSGYDKECFETYKRKILYCKSSKKISL